MYLCKQIMDFRIVHIEETDSTNRWLKENGEGTMVVVADYQTAGKGCGTNTWESERGKNLTFSMLIHPDGILANDQFHITEVVSVAMCKTLQSYIYNKVEIKWPNDIYVGDKKICGILIENRLQGQTIRDCIIGIGLNVNQTEFKSDAPNPVSLCQFLGHEQDRAQLLKAFLQQFNEAWQRETVGADYRDRLYRREGWHTYVDAQGRFEARMTGVSEDGHLELVDKEGQERTYAFKEVQFIVYS
jgi:BirA family biotin operon repressor/biotin-[acetyl-CoA-carboxylase] ligase